MKTPFTDSQSYYRAQKMVHKIKAFYIHLLSYCIVISLFIFSNLLYSPEFHWFWFPVFGWGLGLFFHWLGIFGFQFLGFGKDWEDKKIREYMNQKNS